MPFAAGFPSVPVFRAIQTVEDTRKAPVVKENLARMSGRVAASPISQRNWEAGQGGFGRFHRLWIGNRAQAPPAGGPVPPSVLAKLAWL